MIVAKPVLNSAQSKIKDTQRTSMTDTKHTTRDSLHGFNRSRLRGTLSVAMGVKNNADVFASSGNPWTTTPSEERKIASEKAKLQQHLRQAKLTETQFIGYLRDKLSDPPPPQPVKVDKQRLAQEKKKERPARSCRSPEANNLAAIIGKAKRLAALDSQLRANEAVKAKYSGNHKAYQHFTRVIEPLKQGEREEILQAFENRLVSFLTYILCVSCPNGTN